MAVPKTREELTDALGALYVNASADECWETYADGRPEVGLRWVTYRGEACAVVGIYLAPGSQRGLTIRYILKRVEQTREVPWNP